MELVIKSSGTTNDTHMTLATAGSVALGYDAFDLKWTGQVLRIETKHGSAFMTLRLPSKEHALPRLEIDPVNVPHIDVAKKRKAREDEAAAKERAPKVARTAELADAPSATSSKVIETEELRLKREAKNEREKAKRREKQAALKAAVGTQ
jgi:hypothetical protein